MENRIRTITKHTTVRLDVFENFIMTEIRIVGVMLFATTNDAVTVNFETTIYTTVVDATIFGSDTISKDGIGQVFDGFDARRFINQDEQIRCFSIIRSGFY